MAPMPFQLTKLRANTPIRGMSAKAMKTISAGAANHSDGPCAVTELARRPGGRAEAVAPPPGACVVDVVMVVYFPSVAFIVSANCCGEIFLRKIWSRLLSMVSAVPGLRAWSQ